MELIRKYNKNKAKLERVLVMMVDDPSTLYGGPAKPVGAQSCPQQL